MKKTLCLLLGVMLLLSCFYMIAGCSTPTDEPPSTSTPGPDASANQAGGDEGKLKIISYATGGEPPVLEPVMSNYAKTSILVYNLFCGLTRIGPDGVAELAYAESYTTSDDGLV